MQDSLDEILNNGGCPVCSSQRVLPVKYTFWGGFIGPKLLHHTKCNDCGYTYNRKTRESNEKAIAIYTMVFLALCAGLIYLMLKH